VFEQKLKVEEMDCDQVQFRIDLDLLKDYMTDVDMSTKGVHQMLAPLKDNIWDLNDLAANLSNQLEQVQVEDISWCQSRIAMLEKPNNPTNHLLWQLVNCFIHQVEDQANEIAALKVGLI
jgi:hypothetical protein